MNLLSKSLEFQWALNIYHFHKMFDVGKVWGHLRYKKKSVTFFPPSQRKGLGWRPPLGRSSSTVSPVSQGLSLKHVVGAMPSMQQATLPTNCLYGWLAPLNHGWLMESPEGFRNFCLTICRWSVSMIFQNWKLHSLKLSVRTCQEAASQNKHSQQNPSQNPSSFRGELLVSSTVLHMVVMESLEGFSEFPFNYGWLVSTIFWTFTLAKSGGSGLVGWL